MKTNQNFRDLLQQRTQVISTNLKRVTYIDIIALLTLLILFFFLFSTNLIFPFNRFSHWSSSALGKISYEFPSYLFLFAFLCSFAIVFTLWAYFSKDKLRFIIPLFGLLLRLIGPFSQNQVFGNDIFIHIGIIERLRPDPIFGSIAFLDGRIGPSMLNYPGFLFHRVLAFISILINLNSTDTLLYIGPLIIFVFYIPLGDKLIKQSTITNRKILVGIIYYCFPFVLDLQFGITPFTLIISLYSIIIYLVPFNSNLSKTIGLIISFLSILVHILGLYLFLTVSVILLTKKLPTLKYRLIFANTLAASIIVSLSLIYYSKELKLGTISLFEIILQITGSNFLGVILEKVMSYRNGFLELFLIPKIAAGGVFSIWYIIQFLLYLTSATIPILYLKNKKLKLKMLNSENLTTNEFEDYIAIILIFNSLFLTLALFYGESILWRISYFSIMIVFPLLLFIFENMIKNINIKLFYASVFVFILISPIIIYYNYTIPIETQKEVIISINDNKSKYNYQIVTFSDLDFAKAVYAYGNNFTSIYWNDFWIRDNLTSVFQDYWEFKRVEKPFTLLLVITEKSIAHELQFNNVDISERIQELKSANFTLEYEFDTVSIFKTDIFR